MQLNRALRFLVLGLSAISVAEATFGGINLAGRDVKGLQRKQDEEDKLITDLGPATSTTPPEEPSTTSSSEEPTSEPETSTSTSSSSPTTTKPPTTTSSSETPKPPSTSTSDEEPTPTSSKEDDDDHDTRTSSSKGAQPTSTSTEQPEPSTYIITRIITSTRDDGSPVTYTSETKTTQTPGLAAPGSNNDNSSGMSTQTRNTVIGVVVGVGGAIVLGGLALVAWRIWGRKKPQEETDGLMDYNSAIESKPDSGGPGAARSPFQSTLESYHAPTQVNTASNF
ncbi:hypothetical protein MYCTH_2297953 [Thermothelomyces thermophilus ATCC 42464]|uniref:Mid2 domain-containing protein n=1 Tax=Thermothelomyces thermophilus (strain ATCC 42464 / BCRC 31852 / DSM 1799) TaxID=573729 RepID=G2Q028_THET4|nr:uncharacterized protein MYCTH_2297953 [Thermothelomyces thermophilus ATCC 42464]AEO54852.1 hypothetical protein MYCTH_2297953 [Thermothelomyces thermophilus ATCC 42464]